MKQMILMTFVVALVACESPPVRRSELVAEHPEWSDDKVKLINEGYIVEGMTSEQVRAAWGYPCLSCTGTKKENGVWRTWEFPTQIVFFDENGKVVRWTKK